MSLLFLWFEEYIVHDMKLAPLDSVHSYLIFKAAVNLSQTFPSLSLRNSDPLPICI